MRTKVGKPVVTIYLLPEEWQEEQFQRCFNEVLGAAKRVAALCIKGEDDLVVLFPADRMRKGLGTEIVVKIDLPHDVLTESGVENETADMILYAVQRMLPHAHIQCWVSIFNVARGFMSTPLASART